MPAGVRVADLSAHRVRSDVRAILADLGGDVEDRAPPTLDMFTCMVALGSVGTYFK